MCSRKFSPSDDLRLVHSVKAFPVLYSHERLFVAKNPDIIRENWRAVAAAVGRDGEACKKRWRDIRDHYFKVKRKQQAKDQKWTTRWPLFKSLSFLANAKRRKRHSCDGDSSEDLTEDGFTADIYQPEMTFKEEDPQPEYVDVVVSPRPADSYHASDAGSGHFLDDLRPWETFPNTRQDEDDVDVFMRSVALTVKRLGPRARAEAKLKILSVVTELEFPARCGEEGS